MIPTPRPSVPFEGCPWCGSVERPCCEERPHAEMDLTVVKIRELVNGRMSWRHGAW
jgi:hypothetical protein